MISKNEGKDKSATEKRALRSQLLLHKEEKISALLKPKMYENYPKVNDEDRYKEDE